jgi:hypothetical protein
LQYEEFRKQELAQQQQSQPSLPVVAAEVFVISARLRLLRHCLLSFFEKCYRPRHCCQTISVDSRSSGGAAAARIQSGACRHCRSGNRWPPTFAADICRSNRIFLFRGKIIAVDELQSKINKAKAKVTERNEFAFFRTALTDDSHCRHQAAKCTDPERKQQILEAVEVLEGATNEFCVLFDRPPKCFVV